MTADNPAPAALEDLRRAFRLAYALGFAICVAWPLVLLVLLNTAIQPAPGMPEDFVRELGYTFTGLVAFSALFVAWRWRRVRTGFKALEAAQQPRLLIREVILYSAVLELSAVFGLIYFTLGGPMAGRYARTFIVLAGVMFFVFVPRFGAWKKAAGGDPS